MSYDDTVYTIEVTVSDAGNGKLNIEASENHNALDFTNNYQYTASGEIQFTGTKTLNGMDLTADQFNFVLSGDGVNETVKNAVDGSITFSKIVYDESDIGKTYTYTVKEQAGSVYGMSYDDTVYTIEVTVSDAGNGKLNIEASENHNALDFTNNYQYTASGEIQFTGTKTLNGMDLTADQFSFVLSGEGVNETVKNAADGTFAFSAIKYDETDIGKTYTYTVTEQAGNVYGMSYDDTVYTIEVTVSDAGNGKLDIVATDNYQSLDFTNNYQYTASGEIQFTGTKTLNGMDLTADQFSFVLSGDGVNETVKNAADGSITFSKIVYDESDIGKTYTYTVKEQAGNVYGMTYDDTEYTIEVTVSDAGNGKLNIEASENHNALDFTNNYQYTASGEIQFTGTKTLNGMDLTADQFSFVLSGDGVNETVKNAADGTFAFSAITYDESDIGKTYTYTVKEQAGSVYGMTYDDTEYTIEVSVSDAGNGKLDIVATDNHNALDFTNGYQYTASGEIQFTGTKTLNGMDLTADQFSFVLSGEDVNETVKNAADGSITFSKIVYDETDIGKTYTYTVKEETGSVYGMSYDDTEYTIEVTVSDAGNGKLDIVATDNYNALDFTNNYQYTASGEIQFTGTKTLNGMDLTADQFSFVLSGDGVNETVKNAVDGSITFSKIVYDESDIGKTYTYTVKEQAGSVYGMSYDDTEYTIEVTVSDAGNGKLNIEASENHNALDFTNNYQYTASGEIQFTGTKTLNGMDLTADQFSFVLSGDGVNETVKNAVDGSITFSKIVYDESDIGKTYTYTVKEQAGSVYGMTYDDTVYTIEVTVSDAGNGKLDIVATDNYNALDFTNNYQYTASGEIQFTGTKTLNGMDLTADQFSFVLSGDGVNETVKNAADGSITFSKIVYDESDIGKTYTYTVKEQAGSVYGMSYDDTEYIIEVTVSDAGNGKLDIVATDNYNALDFTNNYQYTASGEIQFTGTKTLNGMDLTADQFSFVLSGEGVNETVKNAADGTFAFSAITYDETDIGKTYTYTVKEEKGTIPGVTYDSTEHTITVSITDSGNGQLNVTPTYSSGNGLSFVNTYDAAGSLRLKASKTVNGLLPREDQVYEFLLKGDGVQMTARNDQGSIVFDALHYELSDAGKSFTYTVEEKTPSTGYLTTDDSVYTVVVSVINNGDGTLVASPTIMLNGTQVDEIVFRNRLNTPLTISKTVEGGVTVETFEMTVRFYDVNGEEATGTFSYHGDVNGSVTSGESIALAHGQKVEIEGLLPGMGYMVEEKANARYTTKVNGLDGRMLQGSLVEGENRVDFVNTMAKAPSIPPTGDKTPLALLTTLLGLSAVALLALARRKKA